MPTLGESIARRRVFWMLVVLVVAPTIALFVYGLAGLKDRVAAEEGRQNDRYAIQAREIEGAVLARLAAEDERLRHALSPLQGDALAEAIRTWGGRGGLVSRVWALEDPEVPDEAHIASLKLSAASPVTILPGAPGADDLAVSRVGSGAIVVYAIDPAVFDAVALPAILGQLFPGERARYHLRATSNDPSGSPVSFEGLRRTMAESLLENEPSVTRGFAPPLAHWRVEVTGANVGTGGIPGLRALMIALFAATVVGVVLLGRAVVQQTRLSRLQTDFVSNVSHELRTPLTSIRLFVETLQSGRVTDPEKVQECLTIIAGETERLSRKIERVLTWAHMEEGRRVYELQPCMPREAVDRALASFRAHNLTGSPDLTAIVDGQLPQIVADPEALAEALLNLLGNASKYGGPSVQIRVRARREGKGVVFVVEDNGPGIALMEQRSVFEKFYRSDGRLNRATEGSGLGLAIVSGIVAAHRGRVELQSVEGSGSRFTIWLPAATG
jgi:two-component system, OmpR family, phosphate regulon sensor histidine kinase PhoR